MLAVVHIIAWIACILYASIPSFWLVIHPKVEFWRSRRRPFLLLVPAWIAMWITLGAVTAPWRRITLYSSGWSWVPAIAFFATGIWIYTQVRHQFSANQLGGLPEILTAHPEQRLVTSGLHARVRHPVYLAHLCELLAWSIATGLAVLYGLTAFAVITGAVMIRLEDSELEQRFGDEYRRYGSAVPAFIPRLR